MPVDGPGVTHQKRTQTAYISIFSILENINQNKNKSEIQKCCSKQGDVTSIPIAQNRNQNTVP